MDDGKNHMSVAPVADVPLSKTMQRKLAHILSPDVIVKKKLLHE